ncbi:MAG: hypothetical protein M1835_000398 [Candelina submexicana]|nr:MAG: hypothetical protein M1835_000398 [Candelina submexicana]
MNLSLRTVTPTVPASRSKVWPSTLQSYNGIVRYQLTSSRLSVAWPLIIGLMLTLPLALSAAYKSFSGGQSVMRVDAAAYVKNEFYYGIFTPPGLQSLGELTGVSTFYNARLPFAAETSSQTGSGPLLPAHSQAYGFNVLSLNNESTAVLDIPQPSYISSVQNLLASGESWDLTAFVFATVASFQKLQGETPTQI